MVPCSRSTHAYTVTHYHDDDDDDDDDDHLTLRQINREQNIAKELRQHACDAKKKSPPKNLERTRPSMGGHASSLPDAWLQKLVNDVTIMRNIYIQMLICATDRRTTSSWMQRTYTWHPITDIQVQVQQVGQHRTSTTQRR